MNNQLFHLLTALLLLTASNAHAFTGLGVGSTVEPYQIATAEQLDEVRAEPSAHYILMNDIDLGSVANWLPIPNFYGTLDGNNHTIINMKIDGYGYNLGLFGAIDSGAEVRNIGIVDCSITGTGGHVGGLAGRNSGSIINSYATGTIDGGGNVGGLVGHNRGSITNGFSTGTIGGSNRAGGLVGYNDDHASITNSSSTGAVSGTGNIGGLAGTNSTSATIATSYATGAVTGVSYLGGLVGENYGSIANSYATGGVRGTGSYVGGLVGSNDGSITTSYATGAARGTTSESGRLVGYNFGSITGSYADNDADASGNLSNLLLGALPEGWDTLIWSTTTDEYPKLMQVAGDADISIKYSPQSK